MVPQISFKGEPNTGYKVQFSTNLGSEWHHLGIIQGNATGDYGYVDLLGDKARFYRVRKVTGVNGQIVAILDPSSPPSRLVQISKSASIKNLHLGTFGLKSQNVSGTLRGIDVGIYTAMSKVSEAFGQIQIKVNGITYSADAIIGEDSNNALARFSGMVIPLPADQYVQIQIFTSANPDKNGLLSGTIASVSLVTGTSEVLRNNPNVEDPSYLPLDVVPAILKANTLTLTSASAVLSGFSPSLGATIITPDGILYPLSYTFTMTASTENLYLSAEPGFALSIVTQTSAPATVAKFSLGGVTAAPPQLAGDFSVGSESGYFIIPAGSSRTFTFTGFIKSPAPQSTVVRVTAIRYVSESRSQEEIIYGLETLKIVLP